MPVRVLSALSSEDMLPSLLYFCWMPQCPASHINKKDLIKQLSNVQHFSMKQALSGVLKRIFFIN